MFDHEFFRSAFLAGTAIALACGLIGFFVFLRAQMFAGDALSHVAFTGAVGAAAAGVDPRIGLFVATIAVALGFGLLGRGGRPDDVSIGVGFTWILGLGVLFLSLLNTGTGGNALLGARTLFGSIFGLSTGEAWFAVAVAAVIVLALAAIVRPLLFSSVDPRVAAARGVPVRVLGLVFLALLGASAAEATQAVGALLLMGLLAAPAGAAQLLSTRPYRALVLSAGIAVAATWAGLISSYLIRDLPPSTAIIAFASGCYLLAFLWTRAPVHPRHRRMPRARPAPSLPTHATR